MALVLLPYMFIPDPTKDKPIFYGKIYIGVAGKNPRLSENQKDALLIQESGVNIPAEYPIRTTAGGVPEYNGSTVAIDVTGTYSLAIDDKDDNQIYYFADAGELIEFLATDLRSIMFALGLTYDDIGKKIIVNEEGTLLDDAEFILNTSTGEVWNIGNSVPPGSTLISLAGPILTTSTGQFNLTSTQRQVENRLKGNQNFNVIGKNRNPVPNSTAETYPAGEEIAAGILAVTECVITKTGLEISGTGTYRRTVDAEFPNDFYGVKKSNGLVYQTGVSINAAAGKTDIDVDIATAGPHKFPQMSEQKGAAPDISDEESKVNHQVANSLPVVNRLAGNQNLNIVGPDGLDLPSGTPTNYPTPDTQFAAGWYVGAAIVGLTYVDGIIDATSGSYYRLYGGDRTADFNAVKIGGDSVSTTGVAATFDGTNTKITVNIATAGPHKFPQMSEQKGASPDISDEESEREYRKGDFLGAGQSIIDQTGKRAIGITYTNGDKPIQVNIRCASAGIQIWTLTVIPAGGTSGVYQGLSNTGVDGVIWGVIPAGADYKLTGGTLFGYWGELS